MNETQIIEVFRRAFRASPASDPGLYDDAVIVNHTDSLVVKADMFVGETDMPPGMTLAQAARKSVVACLSDLAAKGGSGFGFVLSVGIPRRLANRRAVQALVDGFRSASDEYGLKLMAGDVNESRDLILDCIVLGRAGHLTTRNGARAGDRVFSTGAFGYTGLGLRHLLGGRKIPGKIRDACVDAVLVPRPDFELTAQLVSSGLASASMDSSDGLAFTLYEIAEQSGVGIDVERLPMDERIASCGLDRKTLFDSVMYGGEEYHTVITVPEANIEKLMKMAEKKGGTLYEVGEVTSRKGVRYVSGGMSQLVRKAGWTHLAR